jgi:putative ABC transport system substrate-binding protein
LSVHEPGAYGHPANEIFGHRPRDGSVVSSRHCMNDPQPEGHAASYIERRKFLATLGGAAVAWPLAGRAQRSERTPVVGFLSSESRSAFGHRLEGFHRSLAESGYVEGKNVVVEYRWAEGQYERVPRLASDLVHRKVNVIVANYPPVLEAKRATDTIPIIFTSAADPVKIGFVASLNRPGANVTGIYLRRRP